MDLKAEQFIFYDIKVASMDVSFSGDSKMEYLNS